jgi:hypothetical protein
MLHMTNLREQTRMHMTVYLSGTNYRDVNKDHLGPSQLTQSDNIIIQHPSSPRPHPHRNITS